MGILVLLLATAPTATAQNACASAIDRAEEAHYAGLFDQGIAQLQTCVEGADVPPYQQEQVYALLGRLYVAKRVEDQARAALRRLLELAPGYQPDPALGEPAFMALVEQMRQEREMAAPPPGSQLVEPSAPGQDGVAEAPPVVPESAPPEPVSPDPGGDSLATGLLPSPADTTAPSEGDSLVAESPPPPPPPPADTTTAVVTGPTLGESPRPEPEERPAPPRQRRGSGLMWVALGGGAAAAGLAAVLLTGGGPPPDLDFDDDGFNNDVDNCPNDYNPDQSADADQDGVGDACDTTDRIPDPPQPPPGLRGVSDGDRPASSLVAERGSGRVLGRFIASHVTGFPSPSQQAAFALDLAPGRPLRWESRLGPLVAEPAEPLGRGRLVVGTNLTYLVPRDRGATQPDLGLNAVAAGFHATYGLTARLDVGTAFPVVRLSDAGVTVPEGDAEVVIPSVSIRARYHFLTPVAPLTAVAEAQLPTAGEAGGLGRQHVAARLRLSGSHRFGRVETQFDLGGELYADETIPDVLTAAVGVEADLTRALQVAGGVAGRLGTSGSNAPLYESHQPLTYALGTPLLAATLGSRFALSRRVRGLVSLLIPLSPGGFRDSIIPAMGLTVSP